MSRSYLFGLLFIFVIACIVRFYDLNNFPVGFHIDEASLGYNGYSILHTGKDDNNHSFPLYIDIFGDNRPSGYHYLTIVPIMIFGLSEFATRFPGAIFGSITVFAFYYLTSVVTKNKKVSLIASLLIALAPWHVILSRASAESIIALFFVILGFGFVVHSFQEQKNIKLFYGIVSLIISFFFYHTPRIFVPLFSIGLGLFLSPQLLQLKKKDYKLFFIGSLFSLCIVVFCLVFLVPGGTGRFNQVNIFNHPETYLIMEEQIREDGFDNRLLLETRLFHNKVVNYFIKFSNNYLEYFSPSYLFGTDWLPIWYAVPNMGLLYLIELPFILYGIYSFTKINSKNSGVLLLWVLIAPLTAAITIDDIPNINRSIVMFPILELFAAYGVFSFFQRKNAKMNYLIPGIVLVVFVYNASYFFHQYFVHSKTHRTWHRSNGLSQVMNIVRDNYNSYDTIIVGKDGGGIYPLILFYMKYDPAMYQNEGSPKDKHHQGFGKFFFVEQACPSINKDGYPKGKRLIVNKGPCEETKFVKYRYTIAREDGTIGYRIQM